MSIIYFDICSIPLFLMILLICYSRKMTKGAANQLFIGLVFLSLFSTIADLAMEITSNNAPLSQTGYIICVVSTYLYLFARNATNAVLLLFLLALTRTTFLIEKKWSRFFFCLPYACILGMLVQNPFTHNAFTVTAEAGYARAPLMTAFYVIALLYGLGGLIYCIYCRRYLPFWKWSALLSVYIFGHAAVIIQFFYPELLLEMFCTAIAEMQIMLTIMRPEERMDAEVGMLSWASYQTDLRNILLSGENVQIAVIRIPNSLELRHYLGEHNYVEYMSKIADGIRSVHWHSRHRIELYYERPGILYLVLNADEAKVENIEELILSGTAESIRSYTEMGVRFEPQICLIHCPEDLNTAEEIISLGHMFHKLGNSQKSLFNASEIVHSQTFAIEANIEQILDQALRNDHIEMYYQPVYDVHAKAFRSAEALCRIIDPVYGMISPSIFIPAAETEGFIIPLGDMVLNKVFRFVSENDLNTLGLDFIEINLSVAQLMERSLPDKVSRLQKTYGVDPETINFEITELSFENISDIMIRNVNKLIEMGYSFALDDYGTGYSNIQRINHIPLEFIKTDKTMLDEVQTDNGRKILEYTIRMMQSIGKKLVAEGAETAEEVEILKKMKCDYIQGFYFSKPLPVSEFIAFLNQNNKQK